MINKGDKKSRSQQKFKKSSLSLKNISVSSFERINSYQSLQFRKIVRSPVKFCPFHFSNNLPNRKYTMKKIETSNKQPINQKHQSSKSRENYRENGGLYKKVMKEKKRNADSYYNRNQRGEIKKIKLPNNEINKWKDFRKKENVDKEIMKKNQIDKCLSVERQNGEQDKLVIKDSNSQTSMIENNPSIIFHEISSQTAFDQQKNDQIPTKLTISVVNSQIINGPSRSTQLSFQSILNMQIQNINDGQSSKIKQENICLKQQLQQYKTQCKLLEHQLRTTLQTVKSMTKQLQTTKVQSKISETSNNISNIKIKQGQIQYNIRVHPVKNQYQKIQDHQYKNLQIKNQQSNDEMEPKYVQKYSTTVVRTINSTIISSSSPRVIRIGRDRNYCVKGCINYCKCLCPSFSNQLPL